jgi:hypothetical protein
MANKDSCDCREKDETEEKLKISQACIWTQSILGGLAGSSCCLLQLAINALTSLEIISGFGCAGFNKVLGPVRTYARLLTMSLILYSWWKARRVKAKSGLVLATFTFIVLTFLPELLLYTGGPVLAPPTDDLQVIRLRVGGMGCEACARHIKTVLDSTPGVVASSVNLAGANAEVSSLY